MIVNNIMMDMSERYNYVLFDFAVLEEETCFSVSKCDFDPIDMDIGFGVATSLPLVLHV
jgi:hypothetical protein